MADIEEELENEAANLSAEEAEEQEAKDFDEGFTEPSSELTPVEKPEEPEIEEAEEKPAKKEPKKPSYEELEAQISKLNGRFGELTSRVRTMQEAGNKEAKKQKAAIPDRETVEEAATDPQKWAELQKDFPEWSEGVAQYVDLTAKKISSQVVKKEEIEQFVSDFWGDQQEDLNSLINNRVNEILAERQAKIESKIVEKVYPDWQNDVESEEFLRWLRIQDQDTLKLYESDSGDDVVKLLDRYNGKKLEVVPNKRLEGNVPATNRSSVTRTPPKTEEDDFAEGFAQGR